MAIEGKVTLEDVTIEWADHAQGVEIGSRKLFVIVTEVQPEGEPKRWSGVLGADLVFNTLVPAMNWDGEVPDEDECWRDAALFESITGIRGAP